MEKLNISPENLGKIYAAADLIVSETEKAVIGKHREVVLLTAALVSGNHVLIEDVPGVGKTTLAAALAKAAGLDFKRAQFTPDVMASDITGFNIYNRKTESFEFREGLVRTNILLADEINRAAPKTQSSLLEAMEETKVTVDGVTYEIPDPFMVIATENPAGFVGTYPLPEAQLDRFALKLSMGYPSPAGEKMILSTHMQGNPLNSVNPVADKKTVRIIKLAVENITVSDSIQKYIVSLVSATRDRGELRLGASPRASLSLMRIARACAFMARRDFVIPEDVAKIYIEVVSHRVILSRDSVIKGICVSDVLNEILRKTPVPFDVPGKV